MVNEGYLTIYEDEALTRWIQEASAPTPPALASTQPLPYPRPNRRLGKSALTSPVFKKPP
jgi:hypothetical protein